MPPKKLRGTDITSAQGQDTTRNVRARLSQSAQFPKNMGGITASAAAHMTTTGV